MAPAASFNGGRSQIGLNFIGSSDGFPFMNHMKTAQTWNHITGAGPVDPSHLDTNGYPTTIVSGGIRARLYVPTQAERPGRYVILWDGNGTIYQNVSPTDLDGSFTSSGGSGRCEFTTSASSWDIGISAIGSPHITNIRIYHVDDEDAGEAGQVFGTLFLSKLDESGAAVIRLLDCQDGNKCNLTTWPLRKKTSYYSYAAMDINPSIYAGETTNSGDDYSITFGSGAPVDKQTIIVRFNASATTTTPTLNLNSSGAKEIRRTTGNVLSVNVITDPNALPLAGVYASLVFDEDLDCWIKQGGDANLGSRYLNNGAPFETMVDLCAELGAHPYFVTPYLSIDPSTELMGNLAAYIRDNGPSWMIPRFEGPNETWNGAADFYATYYGRNKALAEWGFSNDHHNWYGKVMSVLGQEISAVYSDDRSKYQVICGVQTETTPSSSDARLTSARYVSAGGSAAKNWVTHVCCATYIRPSMYGANAELVSAWEYDQGDETKLQDFIDTFGGAATDSNVAAIGADYVGWKSWAEGHDVDGLTTYEGGYNTNYLETAVTSTITGASKAAQCVLTLATTNVQGIDFHTANSGNPAVVGMQLTITSVGGMTELNGNTYDVVAVNGNSVTIDVNSTGFTTYTSGGTATYVDAPTLLNALRFNAKYLADNFYYTQLNYLNLINAGGEFPAQFFLSGSSYSSGGVLGAGAAQVWGIFDPSIYSDPTPAWEAIKVFNSGRVRFRST